MRKTVLCPYFRQEFDRIEGWCEEMERRGLRFVQFKGQFAVLERGEPRETRYRYCAVEAGMDEIFERERLKYADFGWELLYNTTMRVGYNGEYCLARTVDPAAVEMYTDKESFGALASKQLFISAVVLAVLIAIDIFRFLRICQVGLTELVEYERRVLPLLIMLPLLLCCRIYYGLCTQRTSRRLEADALDREYDPKEVRLRCIFLTCEGALVIAAIAALLLLYLA